MVVVAVVVAAVLVVAVVVGVVVTNVSKRSFCSYPQHIISREQLLRSNGRRCAHSIERTQTSIFTSWDRHLFGGTPAKWQAVLWGLDKYGMNVYYFYAREARRGVSCSLAERRFNVEQAEVVECLDDVIARKQRHLVVTLCFLNLTSAAQTHLAQWIDMRFRSCLICGIRGNDDDVWGG